MREPTAQNLFGDARRVDVRRVDEISASRDETVKHCMAFRLVRLILAAERHCT